MINQYKPEQFATYTLTIKDSRTQPKACHILDAVLPHIKLYDGYLKQSGFNSDLSDALIDALAWAPKTNVSPELTDYLRTPSVQRLYKNSSNYITNASIISQPDTPDLSVTITLKHDDYMHAYESDLTTFLYRVFADSLIHAKLSHN